MVLSMIILFIVALPWYTWLTWKEESRIKASFIFIIIGSLLIVVPGALINLNLRNMYNDGYYPHLVKEERLFEVNLGINKALLTRYNDSLCFGEMKLLHGKTMDAITFLDAVGNKMVMESEGKSGNASVKTDSIPHSVGRFEIRTTPLKEPFNKVPARELLLPGCAVRQELNRIFAEYMNYAASITPDKDPGKFKDLLDPSVYLPAETSAQRDMTLMSALHTLDILKNNILAVESHILTGIVNR